MLSLDTFFKIIENFLQKIYLNKKISKTYVLTQKEIWYTFHHMLYSNSNVLSIHMNTRGSEE